MSQDKLQGVTQARPSRKTTSLSLATEAVWSWPAVLLLLGAVINPVATIISLSIKEVYNRVQTNRRKAKKKEKRNSKKFNLKSEAATVNWIMESVLLHINALPGSAYRNEGNREENWSLVWGQTTRCQTIQFTVCVTEERTLPCWSRNILWAIYEPVMALALKLIVVMDSFGIVLYYIIMYYAES